ncbi:unnamed protein product [Closterium sp. NIES-53]
MMPQAQRISQQRQEVRGRHNGRQNGLQRHCALDLLVLLLLVASRSPAVVSSAAAAAPAAAAAGGETREKAAEASVPPLKESDPLERASAAAVKSSHFETPDIALLRNMSGISTSTGGLYETKGIHGTRGNEAKGNLDIRGIRPTRRAHHSKAIHHNHTTKGAFHTGTGKYEQRLSRKRPRGWPAMKKRPHGRACIRKMSRGSGHRARATSSSESILPLQKIQRGRGKCGKGQRGRDKGESGRGRRKNKISMGKRDRRVGSGDKSSAKPPAPITPGQKKPPASRTPGQKPPGLKPLAPVTPGQKPPVPDTPTTKTPGQAPPAGSRSHTSPDSPGGSPDHHVSMRSNQGGPQQAATGSSSNTSVTQQADKATALAPIPAVAPVPAVAPSCGGNSAGFLTTTAAATSPAAPPAAPPQPPKPKYFIEMGKIRVSGIHTALTHYKTILYIDRTDVSNTYAKLLNGRTAYAEEYSFETNSLRALDVKSNVFCSAGAIDAYGRLISIGGTSDANATNLADPLLDGSASIRSFTPCPPATAAPAAAATAAAASGGTANGGANNTSSASSSSSGSASGNSSSSGGCDFSLVGQMTSKRWYPTAQLLPDGRIFIVGGANVFGNLAINSVQNNNPTFEFWPRKEGEGNYKLRFLEETLPYNLYPFVHLLPSGHLFIFAGQRAILLNYTTNTVYRTLPPLDVSRFGPANTNIFRSYPVTGSSAMLQLSSADGYTPRILICGGSSSAADLTNRDNRTGACLGCAAPATATCGLISPMDPNPKWTYEIMPVARVMPDAVLLLDGTVLICNGGRRGFQGLKQSYAGGDVRTPVIYTPTNPPGKRFWQVPESSRYARMYHSSALLLWDGSVLISGSNPNDRLTTRGTYPTQFAVDRFAPPYLQWGVLRNVLWKVENAGSTPVSSVTLALLVPPPGRLAFATAVLLQGKAKSRTFQELPLTSTTPESPVENAIYFKAQLPAPLEPGKTAQIECYFVVINALTPHPAEISQADPQLVIFRDSHYFTSPYPVRSQSTVLRLPSHQIESFTPLEPSKKADSEIKLGPYEGVDAGEVSALAVHYENNRPFPLFERAEREYEISHWGNVYVTEDYHLVHSGAKHTGMFSRLDYQHRPMAIGVSSLRGLMAVLPERAHTVYYRDEIGNISSSHLRYPPRKAELEIEPRYPLLGGWSVTFRVGYSVPLGDLVSISTDGTRVLNATLGSPFADVPVKHLTVKVVLPEGSYGISADVPFPVGKSTETKYSYLDTVGRPVVVLDKRDVVPEQGIMHFQVKYKFSKVALLTEPLLLILFFFLLFLLFIAYTHSDLTISKTAPAYLAKLHHEEFLDLIQRLSRLVADRAAQIESLDAGLLKLGRSGDVAGAKAGRRNVETELKESGREIAAVVGKIEALSKVPAGPLRTVFQAQTLVAKEKERAERAVAKHTVAVEAYEKNSPAEDPLSSSFFLSLSYTPGFQVLTLVAKDKERAERAVAKHTVAVEAYEKKTPAKEIDAKIGPMQQRLAALKAEIKELVMALEE